MYETTSNIVNAMNCSNDKKPRPRRANSADMRAGCDPILFESMCAVFFSPLFFLLPAVEKKIWFSFHVALFTVVQSGDTGAWKVPTKSQMIPDRKTQPRYPRHGERNRLFPFTLFYYSTSSLFDGRTQINRHIVEKSNIERTSSYRSVTRFVVRSVLLLRNRRRSTKQSLGKGGGFVGPLFSTTWNKL